MVNKDSHEHVEESTRGLKKKSSTNELQPRLVIVPQQLQFVHQELAGTEGRPQFHHAFRYGYFLGFPLSKSLSLLVFRNQLNFDRHFS